MVSVSMITYNHERYLRRAIEGVLAQKTEFPIILIIGEDCSTDKTRQICLEYQKQYPEIIKLRLNKKNIGYRKNWDNNLVACTGNYIAICDGDDYWTDPLKLQKQVDFLEANPKYILAFHDGAVINENNEIIRPTKLKAHQVQDIPSDKLKTDPSLQTVGVCYRNVPLKFTRRIKKALNGDTLLVGFLAQFGDAKYMGKEIAPAHNRIHGEGVWGPMKSRKKHINNMLSYRALYLFYKQKGDIKAAEGLLNNHDYFLKQLDKNTLINKLYYAWQCLIMTWFVKNTRYLK